jgi:hypothetical protein
MAGPVNPKSGFSYDLPTQNTDGSALAPSQIAKFQIGLGTTPGAYTVIKDDLTLEAAKQTTPFSLIGTLAYGQWYAAARTVSKDGKVSNWSNETAFVLEAPTPEPPSNFSVG